MRNAARPQAVPTERPRETGLPMSAPMIRAYQAGRKNQTRRTRGLDRINADRDGWELDGVEVDVALFTHLRMDETAAIHCPWGGPGDGLWLREALARADVAGRNGIVYRADNAAVWHVRSPAQWRWKPNSLPSIFCPREFSRYTPALTNVRVARVQDISEEDAKAEGVESPEIERDEPDERDETICPRCGGTRLYDAICPGTLGVMPDTDCMECDTHAKRFRHLWDSINAKRGYAFESNPYVWCLTFQAVPTQGTGGE